jgi:hypothetical protein
MDYSAHRGKFRLANPSDEIRERMRNATDLLAGYANRSGSFEMLDVLAVLGMVEHQIDMAREVAHHALRQP